jgi:hypothetical protein
MKAYLTNLHDELISNNLKAYRYGNGKAWDNKKRKTRKLKAPRGSWFKRLEKMERSAVWKRERFAISKLLGKPI